MSLKRRLILAAVYVLVVVTIGLEVPLALTVSKQATQLEENRVVRNTSLLAARINDDLGDPQMSVDPTVASAPRSFIAGLVQDTAAIVSAGDTPIRYVVVDRPGRVVADSARMARVGTLYATPERPEFQGVFDQGGDVSVDQRHSDTLNADLLIVTVPVVHFRQAIGAVRATASLDGVQARARRTWVGFGVVGLVAILVGIAATWFLAGSLVRPVKQLEDAAVRLGRGELDARAEPTGPKEIATLARAFNRMASALSANLSAQKDFLANASHQLRTPLTGLRLRLEAIKDQGGNASEQAAKAEVEVDRLAGLVEGLLVLARASSIESTGTDVDLAEASRRSTDGRRPRRGRARSSNSGIAGRRRHGPTRTMSTTSWTT
jgi:signal transduction histidine kinase